MPKLCSVPGCDAPVRRRGWCNPHYQRWYKYGDPTACRKPGSTYGDVKNYLFETVMAYEGDECLIWPFNRAAQGRGTLKLGGRMVGAHRIVCIEAYGPPPTSIHEAAHSCGNGHLGCVAKRHLRWATPKENMADRAIHIGEESYNFGELNGKAKLTEDNVREILELAGEVPARVLADRYGVAASTVSQIVARKTWTHVSPPSDIGR